MRSAKATAMVAPLLLLVAFCLAGARCHSVSDPVLHHDTSGSSTSASASARASSNAAAASAQASSKSNGGRLLLGDSPGTATARVLPVGSYTASCDGCELSAGGILRCFCLGATSHRTSLLDTSGVARNVANCGGELQCTRRLRDCGPRGPRATKFYCTTCVDDEGKVWAASLSGARSCPSVLNCDGVLKCNSC
ncbi:hypothetical protein V8C86DRAFT_2582860 [Haematococcus lacustris]